MKSYQKMAFAGLDWPGLGWPGLDWTGLGWAWLDWAFTPSNSEIICGQNVSTKVVCGIFLFFEKKAMLKI